MATNPYTNQIQNRNFLSPIGFKFALGKTPKVDFFCTNTRIPELSLGLTKQPSYLKDLDIPGEKLTFGDLTLRFLVDENMENYMAIHNWLTGLGFPETTQDYADLVKPVTAEPREDLNQFSDGKLHLLNSNFRTQTIVHFRDLFPISLTSLDFDVTLDDIQYFTAEVTFKYAVYFITGKDGRTRL